MAAGLGVGVGACGALCRQLQLDSQLSVFLRVRVRVLFFLR